MKICFMKKTTTTTKGLKKRKKTFPTARSELNPRPLTWKVNVLSIVPRLLLLKIPVKLIILNTFAYEILPVDAV